MQRPALAAGLPAPKLLLLRAEYRQMHVPLLALIRELEAEFPDRTVAVMVPEIVKTSWWQFLLHTHRTRRLRARLLRFGGSRLVRIHVPWYLDEPSINDGIAPINSS